MEKIKEYKIIKISVEYQDTQNKLNVLAIEGWKVVCSYAYNNQWLILERDRK